jgi:hypothetical protein
MLVSVIKDDTSCHRLSEHTFTSLSHAELQQKPKSLTPSSAERMDISRRKF